MRCAISSSVKAHGVLFDKMLGMSLLEGSQISDISENIQNSQNSQISKVNQDISKLDPLMNRPRISTIVLCAIFALIFAASASAVWLLAVRTPIGQSYEEMVISTFGYSAIPPTFAAILAPLRSSIIVIVLSALICVAALIISIIRKRWLLLAQCCAIFVLSLATEPLKRILPRQMLVNIATLAKNSAPSGHTLLMAAACAILVCAASRAFRAWVAAGAALITFLLAVALMGGHWHRPADVVMSVLIVGAISCAVMAFTRGSAMDLPGRRKSSISVQIVGSAMITMGVICISYFAYMFYQIMPGIELGAKWAIGVSHVLTYWAVAGACSLTFGVLMVIKQCAAAPLSRLGLVGAPPIPPAATSKSDEQSQSNESDLLKMLSSN
nr:phosphatase PAP2 family protein [Gardnerella vaginalis]